MGPFQDQSVHACLCRHLSQGPEFLLFQDSDSGFYAGIFSQIYSKRSIMLYNGSWKSNWKTFKSLFWLVWEYANPYYSPLRGKFLRQVARDWVQDLPRSSAWERNAYTDDKRDFRPVLLVATSTVTLCLDLFLLGEVGEVGFVRSRERRLTKSRSFSRMLSGFDFTGRCARIWLKVLKKGKRTGAIGRGRRAANISQVGNTLTSPRLWRRHGTTSYRPERLQWLLCIYIGIELATCWEQQSSPRLWGAHSISKSPKSVPSAAVDDDSDSVGWCPSSARCTAPFSSNSFGAKPERSLASWYKSKYRLGRDRPWPRLFDGYKIWYSTKGGDQSKFGNLERKNLEPE